MTSVQTAARGLIAVDILRLAARNRVVPTESMFVQAASAFAKSEVQSAIALVLDNVNNTNGTRRDSLVWMRNRDGSIGLVDGAGAVLSIELNESTLVPRLILRVSELLAQCLGDKFSVPPASALGRVRTNTGYTSSVRQNSAQEYAAVILGAIKSGEHACMLHFAQFLVRNVDDNLKRQFVDKACHIVKLLCVLIYIASGAPPRGMHTSKRNMY